MKLKTKYTPDGETPPDSELAMLILNVMNTLPHASRLYPDVYVNHLAEMIEDFYEKKRKKK